MTPDQEMWLALAYAAVSFLVAGTVYAIEDDTEGFDRVMSAMLAAGFWPVFLLLAVAYGALLLFSTPARLVMWFMRDAEEEEVDLPVATALKR